MLNLVHLRPGPGGRIVLVHGFGQRAEVWTAIAANFASHWDVWAVDLPGHGATDPIHDNADLSTSAQLLVESGGPAAYAGYSLGARVLLHALTQQPPEVHAAVLVGVKRGFSNSESLRQRKDADDHLASDIERDGVDRFVDSWLSLPFNERLISEMQHRELRLSNRAEGLAASLRNSGSAYPAITDEELARINVPVYLVRGSDDMDAVIADQVALKAAIPESTLHIVEHCGHAVPFEQPQRFAEIVNSINS